MRIALPTQRKKKTAMPIVGENTTKSLMGGKTADNFMRTVMADADQMIFAEYAYMIRGNMLTAILGSAEWAMGDATQDSISFVGQRRSCAARVSQRRTLLDYQA